MALDYLLLGLLAGLAALERKGFLQAMLSRPIALAPLCGLLLGDLRGGLMVAPPLELFWLGAVNLGAALPAHEALATASIAGGAILAGRALGTGVTPAVAVLAVLAAAPLAALGRRAERVVERFNEGLAGRAEERLREGDTRDCARVNLYGLAIPFCLSFVLAPLAAAFAATAVPAILRRAPGATSPLAAGWMAFLGLACASGAKAMRARRAPLYFVGGALASLAAGGLAFVLSGGHA